MDAAFIDSNWFIYGLLPLLIFLARVTDVTMDTLRIVFVTRGNKIVAPILGFFEIFIWLMAITRIMANLDNFATYIAYALGFAVGNYVGLLVEEKLAIGTQLIRIITNADASHLINNLREKGFGATAIDAEGKNGLVHVIFVVTKRKIVHQVIGVLNHFNPKAFYSIEDVRSVSTNNTSYLPGAKKIRYLRWMRKGR
ncbi:MAG: DUF2179 domain-containing protein [Prolixibacteraceae bacterium]|jgi:uncharacterized protein YebE (UPF0316 family)|nr:DUF2179 domain-containing protein [Prolixibacteraceae bacterium]